MNVSRHEQRVLHALAQGGAIHLLKSETGLALAVDCVTRDGWRLTSRVEQAISRLALDGEAHVEALSGGGPLRKRSGEPVKPPATGAPAKGYKAVDDAPGRYVMEK